MLYRIEFEIAAIVLVLVLLLFYYPRKNFPSSSNRLYKCLLIVAFVTCIMDIVSCYTVSFYDKVPVYLNYIVNCLFLILQNTMPAVFYAYILSMTEYSRQRKAWRIALFAAPYAVSVLLILSSPLTEFSFYFTETGLYKQGPMMPVMYLIAVFYLLSGIIHTIRYRAVMNTQKSSAVYIFVILSISAVVIQFFIPDLLVTGFASACSCLVMYMMLQNPEDRVERETGTFTREAFILSLNDAIKNKKPFYIIIVAADNIDSFNDTFGFEKGSLFLKGVVDYLRKLLNGPIYRLENTSLAFFISGAEQECISQIRERFNQIWKLGDMDIKRSCSICSIAYPESANTIEEMLDIVNYSVVEVKKEGHGTVFYAKDMIPSRERRLIELERQRQFLEEESKEAYRAKDEAERADREKSMFLANMSHEIRTPMNAIIGMTDLILRDDINDRVRTNANDIKGAGSALLAIINDVLDISKIESGKMEISNVEYDVRSVITELVNMMVTRVRYPEVEFAVDIDMNIPRRLYGDELRLKQVFINILNNAAKFTTYGFIRLKVKGSGDGDNYILKVDVEDSGCGIKKSDMDKLFTSFTRIDNKANRSIEGTGLGLALCRKILIHMDGEIFVRSQYGVGSTFSFYVPQRIATKDKISKSVIDFSIISVLVIGNCNDERLLHLTEELTKLSINYSFAENSRDTEQALSRKKFDYVFSYKNLYVQYRDWLKDFGDPEIILIFEDDMSYDDIPDAKLIHYPIYSLNIIKLMEMKYSEEKCCYKEAWQAPSAQILIVDDNPVNLKVIDGLLKCYGIKADTALSGAEAIEAARNKAYDIIFMDHMMPEMDGIEALHIIRSINDYYETSPIVALTANAVYGVRDMFIKESFNEYISKPIATDKLEETLIRLLPSSIIEKNENSIEDDSNKNTAVPYIEGIDTEAGIAVCGGNIERYIDLLGTVYKSGIKKLAVMKACFNNNDLKNYVIEVHALKSVAASVGDMELSEKAKMQETAGKNSDFTYVNEHGEELHDLYQHLLEKIGLYLMETKKGVSTRTRGAITDDIMIDKLLKIKGALEEFDDHEAKKELKILSEYSMDEDVFSRIIELEDIIDIFAYDEAIEKVEIIIDLIKDIYTRSGV